MIIRVLRALLGSSQNPKDKLEEWVDKQIEQGIPRQVICNALTKEAQSIDAPIPDVHDPQFEKTLAQFDSVNDRRRIFEQVRSQLWDTMSQRNSKAQKLEKAGEVDKAIELYEANVRDRFNGTLPYDRLRIIYTRRKEYDKAIRACRVYMDLPEWAGKQTDGHFEHHWNKLRNKRKKLEK